ncbi:MAG TPA: LacI family DNA-binding transcriptional regulator [Mycobacteriales bacterium]
MGGGHNGRPTLEQVAATARVSRSTVSRVVNGEPYVSEAVRDRVNQAIDRLGYLPNPAARTLVTQRSGSVALVFPEPDTRVFTDPFFAGIVRGVSQRLAGVAMQLVLVMLQNEADHARLERYVAAGHVDGVLLVSLHSGDPLPRALVSRGIPAVLNGRPHDGEHDLPYVDVDSQQGAVIATRHLAAQGRTTIATIAGPQDMCAGIDRLAGYRSALGRRYRRSLVAVGDFTRASGARAMASLLDGAPDLDAVFVASDLMAEGALSALRRAGRRVPDDVAVVGFDDSDAAPYIDPPLTTIRQPVPRIGQEMVRLLLAAMNGEPASSTVLPVELVVRGSA